MATTYLTYVVMRKATVRQAAGLERMLALHCELHNAAIEERRAIGRPSRPVRRAEPPMRHPA
jgi:hypothetical protein